MRKSNEESLKEVINQLLDTYKLRDRLTRVQLLHSWEKIMGEAISKRTEKISFKDHTLFIYLTSAPLKEELTYQKEKIKKVLNEELGGDFIKDVEIR
jgi:predicted nucleic acid-binding Zn ribbon protein